MEQVFIFKTSVDTRRKVKKVSTLLESMRSVQQWNFNLDDCDKIMRVVTDEDVKPQMIEEMLRMENIFCENLEYEL
ncbi:hypothetical protein [Olivibacter sitiensis]|uniref:hypothetical protein n=1 Tax=Olivibacter sitiensis TaxID=376470 RepID=UPI000565E818|nr:hypothetical protein [Olivibacter sitiensis]